MKTLYESILGSTKTGISGIYALGNRLEEDGIPCTVIKNDGKEIFLLSDIFGGTNAGNLVFKKPEEITIHNYAYYLWSKNFRLRENKIPNGWSIPYDYDFDNNIEAIKKYIGLGGLRGGLTPSTEFLVHYAKSFAIYDISSCQLLFYDKNGAGLRFIKKIKLKK